MDALLKDLRYALRTFLKTPNFTALALLTLGLGIGVNAVVFSFVNGMLLKPPAGVGTPSRLVAVYTSDFSSGPYGETSYPDYRSMREGTTVFEGVAAYQEGIAGLKDGDRVERVLLTAVSAEFFPVLWTRPALGRLLEHEESGAATAAVISHRLWQRVFGSDRSVVGRIVKLDDRAVTIVGVAPEGFEGLSLGTASDVWISLDPGAEADRGRRELSIIARLLPDASLALAQAQLAALSGRLGDEFPGTNMGTLAAPDEPRPFVALRHTRLHPSLREGRVGAISTILLGAVIVVLLVACANVANLMLARTSVRTREFGVRLALGAGRGRLIRQMITESLVLAAAGGFLGLLFALWTVDLLPSFFPPEQARLLDSSVDWRVVLYTLAISLAASLLFGCGPAVHVLRPAAASALRGDAGRVSDPRGGSVAWSVLVSAQVALAAVLLVAGGLLLRSVSNALEADLGFATRQALLANVELPASRPADLTASFYDEAAAAVHGLPGVLSASFVRTLPLERPSRRGFQIEGYQPRQGEQKEFAINVVDHRYFDTMQVRIVAGRTFEESDHGQAPAVAIVNEAMADRYFQGSAVGRRLTDSMDRVLTVVGVVPSAKYPDPGAPVPVVYYPLAQAPSSRMTLVARADSDPAGLAAPVRAALSRLDGDAAIYRVVSLEAHIAGALAGDRLMAALVATCAGLALVLALVGIHSVVAYGVGRRTREIGLRVALGARPSSVLRLVLRGGAQALAGGLVIGLAGAVVAARLLRSMLYGVDVLDPLTFSAVAAALAVVALLAAILPASRALAVDPAAALRQE